MKTNINKLVKVALQSTSKQPSFNLPGVWAGYDGKARVVPGIGGITYSHYLGDNCIDIVGDHVEAGVSSVNLDYKANCAYITYACVGNEVTVLNGAAKDAKGIIVGKHGGCDHVMIAFNEDTINKLTYDDKFMVKGYGQGLELLDYPNISVMNLDPTLLEKMPKKETNDGISFGVKTIIPAFLLGSGLGSQTSVSGDYDIMMHDERANKEYNLNELCFGDLVLIQDHVSTNGYDYYKGATTLGVIVHSNSFTAGHGPGVCTLLTSKDGSLKGHIDNKANLKDILNFKK